MRCTLGKLRDRMYMYLKKTVVSGQTYSRLQQRHFLVRHSPSSISYGNGAVADDCNAGGHIAPPILQFL
jgi:hypothetical protein